MEKDSPCRGGSGAQLSAEQGRGESIPGSLACLLSTAGEGASPWPLPGRRAASCPFYSPRDVWMRESSSCALSKAWCHSSPGGPLSQGGSNLSPLFGGCCSGHPIWSGALQPALLHHGCRGAWTRQDTLTTVHHWLCVNATKAPAGHCSPHAPECSKAQHTSTFQVILLFFSIQRWTIAACPWCYICLIFCIFIFSISFLVFFGWCYGMFSES